MTLDYLISPRTNGANPFHIFESIPTVDQVVLEDAIRAMPYSHFLRTAYWFSVAMVAKSEAGMRCQVCNSQDRIEVHHRTYDCHGREHRHMRDLVVLCHHCHGLFHGHKEHHPEQDHRPPRLESQLRESVRRHKMPVIPDGSQFILTEKLLKALETNGTFTSATLHAIGMRHPLLKGWKRRIVGKAISRDIYLDALGKRGVYAGKRGEQ